MCVTICTRIEMTTPPKMSSIPASVQKKVSMAMTKGRPGSLSLPSFTFRFKNTDEESLEELNLGEISESSEHVATDSHDEASERDDNTTVSPPISPTRMVPKIPKLKSSGKRTQSLDDGSPDHASTSDTWALFSEIKGKIARTVEEKLHSSGIYKKEIKDVGKILKPSSPVEEAIENLDITEAVKSDSSPFNLRRMINVYDSPQLRFRRKELQEQPQSSIKEVVTFSNLVSSSSEDKSKSEDSSPEAETILPEVNILPHASPAFPSNEVVPRLSIRKTNCWNQKWHIYKSKVYLILIAFLLWCILPSFMCGLIWGFALTVYAQLFWLNVNHSHTRQEIFEKSSPKNLLPPTANRQLSVRKIWMNELLSEYSPVDYHLSMTQSVLVRLDGSALRVSYPKSKIHKRAMWNEAIHESSFVYQRYYELKGAKVDLLPERLARKRRWSRRYPIQIQITQTIKHRDSLTIPSHLVKENENLIILFTRSGRDKEEWYWRFKEAILSASEKCDSQSEVEHKLIQQRLFKYHVYMSRFIQLPFNANSSLPSSDAGSNGTAKQHDSLSIDSNSSSPSPSLSDNVEWLNILLGRCCSDVLLDSEDNKWIERLSDRIQRKLSLIKVPYFMDELRLSDLEIGSQLPQIGSISLPYLNDRGLWFHVNVSYFGSFRMTLETKLNLLRLKKEGGLDGVELGKEANGLEFNGTETSTLPRLAAIYDSEAEESVESSSDEEPFPDTQGDLNDEAGRAMTGNKIFRFVDSIAQSRYFQHATEYKYVKKAMEGVSNTPLILTVELLSLSGTLAVNIPPPPTDRLWYGFSNNPDLVVVAKPKVGERQVQIAQITEWIEKKLIVEFQRILVLPNMEDLVIPVMNSSFSTNVASSTEPKDDSAK